MDSLKINSNCNLCGQCIEVCPFDAISIEDNKVSINGNCKLCKMCIKGCPQKAISLDVQKVSVDKKKWQGIMVYAEYVDGQLHPVTYELIGKAKELAKKTNMPVYVLLIGYEVAEEADLLLEYGVDRVFTYENKVLEHFCVDSYANVFTDIINDIKPSVVLVGGTSIGRSLAPRVSTRFKTGLTADCTTLDIKDNTDLVQIRPAFGGNIMAQIITPYTRPQFATVRYKVMDSAKRTTPHGEVVDRKVTKEMIATSIEVINIVRKDKAPSITEAEILVVAGQGIKSKDDLEMVQKLANLLGGQLGVTRPIVEKGWVDYTRQIGLSGRTVKPKLIITCGVSGAIQFTACMNASDCIVAINSDKNAPIFKIAHYGIVGDIYKVVPNLINKLDGGSIDAI